MFIVFFNIFHDFFLMFMEDFDHKRQIVCRLIIDNNQLVFQWAVNFIIEESVKLDTIFFNLVNFLIIVQILVSQSVNWRLLYKVESFLSTIDSNIYQLKAQMLELFSRSLSFLLLVFIFIDVICFQLGILQFLNRLA